MYNNKQLKYLMYIYVYQGRHFNGHMALEKVR